MSFLAAVTVVIPCFNTNSKTDDLVQELIKVISKFEYSKYFFNIKFIDDNSLDDTFYFLNKLDYKYGYNYLIEANRLKQNMGVGYIFKTEFLKNKNLYFTLIPGDNVYELESLFTGFNSLIDNRDYHLFTYRIGQGSRSYSRYVISKLYSKWFRFLLGAKINDPHSIFVLNTSLISKKEFFNLPDNNMYHSMLIMIIINKLKNKFIQTPINYKKVRNESSIWNLNFARKFLFFQIKLVYFRFFK